MNVTRTLAAAACTGLFLLSNAGAASAAAPDTSEDPTTSPGTSVTTSEPQYAYERDDDPANKQVRIFYGETDGVGIRRGQARVHGWWRTDDAVLKTHKATLTLELQHLFPDGWKTVNTGTRTIKPKRQTRNRQRSVCNGRSGSVASSTRRRRQLDRR